MIPVIDIPSWIASFSEAINMSYHKKRFLTAFILGLILSPTKTVRDIARVSLDGPSSAALNKFLTKYDWDAAKANRKRIEELQNHNETRWKKRGLGIIDDTLLEKEGENIPFSGKFYDHAKGVFMHGQSFVSLHFADHKTSYAVDYRPYIKKGEPGHATKIQLAKDLITEAIENMGMPAFTFMFDSWYLCDELIRHIESYGRLWIAASKTDRLVLVNGRYISIAGYIASLKESDFENRTVNGKVLLVHHKSLYFKSLGKKARLIISKDGKGTLILVTNRSGTVEGIIEDYMLRWNIETFHKDAKQYLGLGKCQLRDEEGAKRYWYLVLMAHSVLRLGGSEYIPGIVSKTKGIAGAAKGHMIDAVYRFVSWVMESGLKADEITVMIMDRWVI